ncbi:MAG: hypothetical protein FWE07_06280 [Turicibacter sp.]|nr:hypothetical protein [Turicibacter sp.]
MQQLRNNQPWVNDFLEKSVQGDQLVHAYLFFGGSGLDRLAAAKYFARLILGDDARVARLVEQEEHANVITIRPDGKLIKKEQIVFLKGEIAKKSVEDKAKIYVIDGAEKMTASATNSLLKFLEEPAPGVHIILLSPSKEALLSTIVSRTVNVNFAGADAVAAEISAAFLAVIGQLEAGSVPAQLVVAKFAAVFKEQLPEFLDAYLLYYQVVLDVVLGLGDGGDFDKNLLEISVMRNDVSSCTRKLRAIERAKRHLRANMNVALCVDQLWLDFE